MRISTSALGLLAALSLVLSVTAHAQAREEGRLLIASQVLEELRDTPDQSIPDRLLDRAYGIAVIPDLTKVAFFAGGRWGRGVLVVRDSKGQFGNPVFISMTGGSFGWQWGVQSTDIVLVFTTEKGVRGFSGGKLTLGADASVAAGPVGRSASAATDQSFKAEVYSYSRNRGAVRRRRPGWHGHLHQRLGERGVLQEAQRLGVGHHQRDRDQPGPGGAALHGRGGHEHRDAAHGLRRRPGPGAAGDPGQRARPRGTGAEGAGRKGCADLPARRSGARAGAEVSQSRGGRR